MDLESTQLKAWKEFQYEFNATVHMTNGDLAEKFGVLNTQRRLGYRNWHEFLESIKDGYDMPDLTTYLHLCSLFARISRTNGYILFRVWMTIQLISSDSPRCKYRVTYDLPFQPSTPPSPSSVSSIDITIEARKMPTIPPSQNFLTMASLKVNIMQNGVFCQIPRFLELWPNTNVCLGSVMSPLSITSHPVPSPSSRSTGLLKLNTHLGAAATLPSLISRLSSPSLDRPVPNLTPVALHMGHSLFSQHSSFLKPLRGLSNESPRSLTFEIQEIGPPPRSFGLEFRCENE